MPSNFKNISRCDICSSSLKGKRLCDKAYCMTRSCKKVYCIECADDLFNNGECIRFIGKYMGKVHMKCIDCTRNENELVIV